MSRGQRSILITGSSGLIGSALRVSLKTAGFQVHGLDLRGQGADLGDVRHTDDVERCMRDCTGVVHLAAVSRVIDAERTPDVCWATNVQGTQAVLDAAEASPLLPWVIYASSREVYGQPATLPATEDTPLRPINIYGRSKVEAERLCTAAASPTAIVRFSNVYGTTDDHPDRVIPAFARQAVEGLPLRVDGHGHTFDFTHLDDTIRGLMRVVDRLEGSLTLPPIQFTTGEATTLGGLASLAVELAASASPIVDAPPRTFDVSGFVGDGTRARDILDWGPRVRLRAGLGRLIEDFARLQKRAESVAGSDR
jgi:nucleoside-diphosphate-sugar epimerase